MVVISAPNVNKICESFTHNPLTKTQVNTKILSLMGIDKECISNTSKFESDFQGVHHGCACVALYDQQYALHSHIEFVPPIKLGRSPTYPLNPMHGYITFAYQKYHNNVYD